MKMLVYIGLDLDRGTIVIAVARRGRKAAMLPATIAHDALVRFKRSVAYRRRTEVEVGHEGSRSAARRLRRRTHHPLL